MVWRDVALMGDLWIFVLVAYFVIWRRRHDSAGDQASAAQPNHVDELYRDDGKTFARRLDYDEDLSERDRQGPPFSGG